MHNFDMKRNEINVETGSFCDKRNNRIEDVMDESLIPGTLMDFIIN